MFSFACNPFPKVVDVVQYSIRRLLHGVEHVQEVINATSDVGFVISFILETFLCFQPKPLAPFGHFAAMSVQLLPTINQASHPLAGKGSAAANSEGSEISEIRRWAAEPEDERPVAASVLSMARRTITSKSNLGRDW
jgi:hypothetical protein